MRMWLLLCCLVTLPPFAQAAEPATHAIADPNLAPITPPKLSLSLQAQPLDKVAEAMSAAMGATVKVWPGGREKELFTLEARDKTFWDIFAMVSAQHPIVPRDSNGMSMAAQGWGIKRFTQTGGLILYADGVNRQRVVTLQALPGSQLGPPEFNLLLTMAADPRVVVLRHGIPQHAEIVDDEGNNLLKAQIPDRWTNDDPSRAAIWSFPTQLQTPEKLGARIRSLKTSIRLTVQTEERRIELANLAERPGQSFPAAGGNLTVSAFTLTSDNLQMETNLALEPAVGGTKPLNLNRLILVDAANREVYAESLPAGKHAVNVKALFNLPLKVILKSTTQMTEVTVPFELNDIPIPQ